ncbi:acyltransferase domain-containing protein, partial [Myxococcus sp. 1LA]
RGARGLRALAHVLRGVLAGPSPAPLSDLCFSAATRRAHHEHRLALLATDDVADLATRLSSFASGNPAELGASGRTLQAADARPVFVFTGMGPQWWAMGRELYAQDALFRATLERCDAIFQRLSGWSLLEQMLADEKSSNMARADIAQPANTFLQMGLLEMWRRAGIEPAAVIGHSAGEVASAYAAGRFTLEQAMLVIYERSRIQAKAAGLGKMAAVGLSEEGARAAIRGREALVSIAAINGPNGVTLSGDAKAIEEIAAELEARGVFQRILKVEVPYHSPAMEGLKPELRRCLASLQPSAGHLPTYSTVTGGRVEGVSYDAEYWCDNIREPTLFAKAAGQMLKDGYRLFIELGPTPCCWRPSRSAARRPASRAASSPPCGGRSPSRRPSPRPWPSSTSRASPSSGAASIRGARATRRCPPTPGSARSTGMSPRRPSRTAAARMSTPCSGLASPRPSPPGSAG